MWLLMNILQGLLIFFMNFKTLFSNPFMNLMTFILHNLSTITQFEQIHQTNKIKSGLIILIVFTQLRMNANRPYSKSLRLFVHKSPPIQQQLNRFIKRSPSFSKDAILYQFPQLKTKMPFNITNRITPTEKYAKTNHYGDKSKEQALRQTNQSYTPKIKIPPNRYIKDSKRSNMEEEIDEIMNEVIVNHSPKINNNTIQRSISTKKFKNVRIITDIDEIAPAKVFKEAFIKEIIDFMRKNSKPKRHKKKQNLISRDEPSLYNQEMNQFTPNALLKKSQEILELHPIHEFKQQEEMFMNKPINSQIYIRQLRSNKMFVKQVQLKKY